MKHRSPLLARALSVLVLVLAAAWPARAWGVEVDLPMSVLIQAPHQLEVTVLSVEEKDGPHSGSTFWHRVRVERVMAGGGPEGFKVGDEVAVVSTTRRNPPGAVGGTGHRGLPSKGDRVRVFATGTTKMLQPLSPNGWQPGERTVSFIAADEAAGAETTAPLLAGLVKECGLGGTKLHLAAAGDGRGSPLPTPKADEKAYLTDQGWLRSHGDVIVLCARGLAPDYNTALGVTEALLGGRPIVALASGLETFAPAHQGAFASFDTGVLGGTPGARKGARVRVLAPDAEAAAHPALAGVTIPKDGLLLPVKAEGPRRGLLSVTLAEGCRVLLWGQAVDAGGAAVGEKQPVVWVREVPRRPRSRDGSEIKLPSQRVAVTTLGDAADFAHSAELRVLAVQMVAWASGEDSGVDNAERARRASFVDTELRK